MSKLDELIKKYCPNGVKLEKLANQVQILRGERLTKSELIENGKYSVIHGGTTPMGFYDKFNRKKYSTIVINTGNAGDVFFLDNDFWSSDACFTLYTNENLNNKFVYYFLKQNEYKLHSKKRPGAMPTIDSNAVANIIIPLPPIEVQNEIVRILDSFTQFEAELTAELTLRKKQYEYYRDLLLSFDEGIPSKTLAELGTFYAGLSGKKKEDFVDGNEKFITYMNIFKNPNLNTNVNDKVKIQPNEKQNTIQYGDILITGSSETPEEAGFTSVLTTKTKEKLYLNSFSFGYRLNNLNLYNPEFLQFLFRSAFMRKQIRKTVNGVTRFNISKEKFEKIYLPIIPIEKQNKIANVLNSFYKLSVDIMNGLPKEIELVHKQYEYYRNKLLTFKELKA